MAHTEGAPPLFCPVCTWILAWILVGSLGLTSPCSVSVVIEVNCEARRRSWGAQNCSSGMQAACWEGVCG